MMYSQELSHFILINFMPSYRKPILLKKKKLMTDKLVLSTNNHDQATGSKNEISVKVQRSNRLSQRHLSLSCYRSKQCNRISLTASMNSFEKSPSNCCLFNQLERSESASCKQRNNKIMFGSNMQATSKGNHSMRFSQLTY